MSVKIDGVLTKIQTWHTMNTIQKHRATVHKTKLYSNNSHNKINIFTNDKIIFFYTRSVMTPTYFDLS